MPSDDFVSLYLLQSLPHVIAQLGDNPIELSRQSGDGILVMTTVMVRTAQQKTAAHPKCKEFFATLRGFAKPTDENLKFDWEYINCANETQNLLGSYGAENIKMLREVFQRYNLEQVFQKLCRGRVQTHCYSYLTRKSVFKKVNSRISVLE